MNELTLQDKFIIPFFRDELGYQEVKANTVTNSLVIEEDLQAFISDTKLNEKPYRALLRKYGGDTEKLLADLIALIQERSASHRNAALFLNKNKSVTLEGVQLHLFYPSDSVMYEDALFEQNIFSVVQELPYTYRVGSKKIFSFRPDISVFVNGIYLGYSELKSNYTNQSARKNGRGKVVKDYFEAVKAYFEYIDSNDALADREKERYRKDFLKIFERAIHITTTDVGETYAIRNLSDFFNEALETFRAGRFDREGFEQHVKAVFKPYPLLNPDAPKGDKLKEVFAAHYAKRMLEKEILYYNFIERDIRTLGPNSQVRDQPGLLIAPRPKQKFGTDKIIAKIDEFLAHEDDDSYFIRQLEKQLEGVSEAKKRELIQKRLSYANNKNVYSLLLQYAAGFGKSNIIGWSALQLKDLRRGGAYVYDKIMLVVDRLQLREQLNIKLLNMNIDNSLYVQAHNKKTFLEALSSDKRIVIVNLQKFTRIREVLDGEVLDKLARMRIVFLIDEIHRSHGGASHDEMINVFDQLQSAFDNAEGYNAKRKKKNLIVGFTATPNDHSLARFGEYSGYAEAEKIWVPFDSYTMREAIQDGYILNPLENVVPVASKMIFQEPPHRLRGFTEPDFKDVEKKQIYEDRERIDAIAAYVADLLVKDVYKRIRGTAKAMLAVYSIDAAIAYKDAVTRHFNDLTKNKKYARYADAPIYVVFSDTQDKQKTSSLNGGLSEKKVLENFATKKNGLMIVVAKLQTGFDERRLHTLFLDKEVKDINAIQTISRVNRTTKYKTECRIVDFSYDNVNVQNIKDAFEHYSNVVVSDFDPYYDKKFLEQSYAVLRKRGVYAKFFETFASIHQDKAKRDDPESFLDLENSLERYIHANPERTADTKAKAAQYFTILNRIEHVITLDDKFSEGTFLAFYRKFNQLYNLIHRVEDPRDSIEVYFDNQIGMIEKATEATAPKQKKPPKMAEGRPPGGEHKYDVLAIIEARNQHEEVVGTLIEDFAEKIESFFEFVKNYKDGERLIVKIRSHVSEDEIYEDFARIYRTYKAVHRRRVGEQFFKETEDIVDKLCDDFEKMILGEVSGVNTEGAQARRREALRRLVEQAQELDMGY